MSESTLTVTVGEAIARHRGPTSPLLECQVLLAHVLGVERSWLYAHDDAALDGDTLVRFEALLAQRQRGVPIAYLVGSRSFWDMELEVSPATLVPRPETELLVETLLGLIDESPHTIVDAGTGSGAIALALARERPRWAVVGIDISAEALSIASRNARHYAPGVGMLQSSWLDAIAPSAVDAIVCNPPYIRMDDIHLKSLVHEPRLALTAGEDGLRDIRAVVAQAAHCLVPGGWLLMEHGFDQAEAVRQIAHLNAFSEIDTLRDAANTPRALIARRPS